MVQGLILNSFLKKIIGFFVFVSIMIRSNFLWTQDDHSQITDINTLSDKPRSDHIDYKMA